MSSVGLQELTRRLQEERDALRVSLDEITRQLSAERSTRAALEHELQVKELEVLHEQQRTRQAKQNLRDKLASAEKELEDERTRHQMAALGRNVAAEKNATLSAELKEMEAKYKKEQSKKETVEAEVEQLQEEMRALALDRDQIIQRTEADARRVRQLWEQLTREHETQAEVLRVELDSERQAKVTAEEAMVAMEQKTQELQTTLRDVQSEKKALEDKMLLSSNEALSIRDRLERERERDRERDTDQAKSQLLLHIQELKSKCALLEEREKIALREKEIAVATLTSCQKELEGKTEDLLALKTEFSDLLDKYEHSAEEFKQKTRERDVRTRLRLKKLEATKQCAEQIVLLRKKDVHEYKEVMRSVNRRLNEVREKQQLNQANAWSHNPAPAPKSLSIYCHQ
ncbi:hypothetical protein Poli38472_006082 [Pythium oligandrum]|uniref:Uncharacterized protein n=1 Tax=Pythium oligandrum TaxID=41045 RepID=A0A8K1CSV4_PYTOL|nr:hypothetical protein Poli38472_006082 [Pythium oligandrum]|eukprot:TMW68614.1 hypothetical protein Poli38472_006082 [Pythium oligandrum]